MNSELYLALPLAIAVQYHALCTKAEARAGAVVRWGVFSGAPPPPLFPGYNSELNTGALKFTREGGLAA
jgi:hypothetical protein